MTLTLARGRIRPWRPRGPCEFAGRLAFRLHVLDQRCGQEPVRPHRHAERKLWVVPHEDVELVAGTDAVLGLDRLGGRRGGCDGGLRRGTAGQDGQDCGQCQRGTANSICFEFHARRLRFADVEVHGPIFSRSSVARAAIGGGTFVPCNALRTRGPRGPGRRSQRFTQVQLHLGVPGKALAAVLSRSRALSGWPARSSARP